MAFGNFEIGVATIFGSLAYKSAKKRRLELVKGTLLRKVWEAVAINIALAYVYIPLVLFPEQLWTNFVLEPVVYIPIVWVPAAYYAVIKGWSIRRIFRRGAA